MQLKETVEYMLSNDYRERFLGECYQVGIRIQSLKKMLSDWENNSLKFVPTCSKELLELQLTYMENYLGCLIERALIEDIKINFNII